MKKFLALLIYFVLLSPIAAKDLKIIVSFAAGGSTDIVSRELQKSLEQVGIKSVIEYKLGAGGLIGLNYLASNTEPSILINGPAALILPYLQKDNVKYNLGKDVHFLDLIGIEPIFVVTNTKNEHINTINDLNVFAKTNFVNFGSPGVGTSSSLLARAIFDDLTNVTVINYKGGAEVLQGVLRNEIQVMTDPESVLRNFIGSNKLKPLAVVSPTRISSYQNVPTLRELNTQKFDSVGLYRWQGIFFNNAVSKEVLDIIKKLLKESPLKNQYSQMGYISVTDETFLNKESKKIDQLLKIIN